MRLVLLGAPGAGKGTQAVFLKSHYKLSHISTGEIFRENLKDNTPLGIEAKKYMDSGELVPDAVVMKMISDRLERLSPRDGFMLDGFPRTVAQAEFLEKFLNGVNLPLDAVLYFHVPDEEIVKRLTSRLMCRSCGAISNSTNEKCPSCGGELYRRDDDNEETIRSRLKVFHDQTGQLVDFYRSRGLLKEIDAIGEPEEVFSRVLKLL